MSTHLLARNLLILGACLPALGASSYDDSPEAWQTLLDLEIAGKVLEIDVGSWGGHRLTSCRGLSGPIASR